MSMNIWFLIMSVRQLNNSSCVYRVSIMPVAYVVAHTSAICSGCFVCDAWFRMRSDTAFMLCSRDIRVVSMRRAQRSYVMFGILHFTRVNVVSVSILFFAIGGDRKSTRLNSSHSQQSRMPSSA